MARKEGLTLAMQPVRNPSKTYADYPGCLPKYKWLVEEALRGDYSKLFQWGIYPYCKACGILVQRSGWESHVMEHAVQLNLDTGIKRKLQALPKGTMTSPAVITLSGELKEPGNPILIDPRPVVVEDQLVLPLYPDIVSIVSDTIDPELTSIAFSGTLSSVAAEVASVIAAGSTEMDPVAIVTCEDCD